MIASNILKIQAIRLAYNRPAGLHATGQSADGPIASGQCVMSCWALDLGPTSLFMIRNFIYFLVDAGGVL